jgi:hypothetical protein
MPKLAEAPVDKAGADVVAFWRKRDMRVIANLTTTWLAQQGCHGFRPPERMLDDCKLAFIEKRTNFVSSKCKESKRGRAAPFNALAAEAKRITLRFGPCCPEFAGENVPRR